MNKRLTLLLVGLVVAGCVSTPVPEAKTMSDLVFLTRGGCVNTSVMRANLDAALQAMGLQADYQFVHLETLAETDPRIGYPTPTMLYKGADVFGMAQPTPPFPEPT